MLVLSRKKNQTFQFPNLGISIEILRVKGNTVQVGVDAPRDIRVLRGELVDDQNPDRFHDTDHDQSERKQRHELRNQLNTANLALHMLQKRLDAGRFEDAEKMLGQAVKCFETLDKMVSNPLVSSPRQREPTLETQAETNCRALVVEDNPNERQLLAGFLELNGYQVDTVPDGVAAMQYLAKHADLQELPDLVLLDMHMPRMDGRATVKAIRSNPNFAGLKLFVVSGADQAEMKIPGGDRGIDHWFAKPLQPANFVKDLTSEMTRECSLN